MSRRWRLLYIYPPLMQRMLSGHEMSEVSTDFPADAEITHCGWDSRRGMIVFRVESSTFDEVSEGATAPDLNIRFTEHRTELQAIIELMRPDQLITT